ncbi:MAG: iron-sulfur cluster assembly scaffold protein [Acidobacteriota bacterium]
MALHSPELLEHFQNPRNVGQLAPPAVTVEVTNPACGDILRLAVRFEEGRIVGTAYQVRGCTASIAAGSALTEWLQGKTRDELQAHPPEAIREAITIALGGLPAASTHVAVLCADGVKALLSKSAVS